MGATREMLKSNTAYIDKYIAMLKPMKGERVGLAGGDTPIEPIPYYVSSFIDELKGLKESLGSINYSLTEVDKFLAIFDDIVPDHYELNLRPGLDAKDKKYEIERAQAQFMRYLEIKTKLLTEPGFFKSIQKICEVLQIKKDPKTIAMRAKLNCLIFFNCHSEYMIDTLPYSVGASNIVDVQYPGGSGVRFYRGKEFIGDAEYIQARNGKFVVEMYNQEKNWFKKPLEIQFTQKGYRLIEITNQRFSGVDILWRPTRDRFVDQTAQLGVFNKKPD